MYWLQRIQRADGAFKESKGAGRMKDKHCPHCSSKLVGIVGGRRCINCGATEVKEEDYE